MTKYKNLVFIFIVILSIPSFSQDYYNWDSYTVNEFYKQVYLDYGTLDQWGNDIDYIYVITDIDPGIYEIEISDADDDLYEIKGTDCYIRFVSYFGYAGYAQEGILEVSSYGATFYKNDYY